MDHTKEQLHSQLVELDRDLCKGSLLDFVKQGWPSLEPGMDFTSGWAVEAVSEHLEAVSRGEIRRLLINIPPGCTKSMLTNVFWPAWEWGPLGMPHYRYISGSYAQTLATRDLVRSRDLIKSEWYQARWPLEFKTDQDQKTYYENTNRGFRFATGVGGSLTGFRGDRIILDDPHSVKTAESDAEREEALRWFTETLPTRFNKQGESALVIIMQRLHERDVSGHVLDKLGQDYTKLILPMEYEKERHCKTTVVMGSTGKPFSDPRKKDDELLWPERFSREDVDELKRVLSSEGGSYAVAGQLQQRPVPRGGGMFQRKDFNFVDRAPEGGRSCRGWDLAASKDKGAAYTVGLKMKIHDGNIYICDVWRDRASPKEVEDGLRTCGAQDGKDVPVSIPQDPGQAGKAQKSTLAKVLQGYTVHFSLETGSKEDRARPLAAQAEAGNIYLVRGPWNDAFIAEATLFPNGQFMDQVDAGSRAYAYLLADTRPSVALVAAKVIG